MCTIKIIDITLELNDQVKIYEGDPQVLLEQFYSVESNGYAITKISMGSHSGTHIDAPSHVVAGGRTVNQIPLSSLVGQCVVVPADNLKIPAGIKMVLIKGTDAKEARINEKQATKLVDAGVCLVGTDALSIGSDEVHDVLLSEGCPVLESLDLKKAEPGIYMLCALPLKIKADGAPVRACLIQGVCE
ncbi:cyclase family protein [Christensenellaceae bacterium OttesenSCG-928-K19]|nr:cyclase family protein [Christensenellaceae bacterium OttesenSCG-928-K19]